MREVLQRTWLRRGLLARLLLPFSFLFAALAAARRAAYATGLLRTRRLPVPVIVVGNVIAGGAGKTPVTIALVQHLQSRGLAVGVISRGYGRSTVDCREVHPDDDAREVGDEPLLIARACHVPVFVAPRRADAGHALLAAYSGVQLIVCDDGLQHLELARDIEICVFDERGTGNGWLMPAGPLREHWPRKVDLVLRPADVPIPGNTVSRRLAEEAVRADGTRTPLASLRGRELAAVAAIAKPAAFFAMLEAAGLSLSQRVARADHDPLDALPSTGSAELVCTEKDAVKLWRTRPDAWAVPLAVTVDDAFWSALDARLSWPDASQTR